jgi:hypothetical protein
MTELNLNDPKVAEHVSSIAKVTLLTVYKLCYIMPVIHCVFRKLQAQIYYTICVYAVRAFLRFL